MSQVLKYASFLKELIFLYAFNIDSPIASSMSSSLFKIAFDTLYIEILFSSISFLNASLSPTLAFRTFISIAPISFSLKGTISLPLQLSDYLFTIFIIKKRLK